MSPTLFWEKALEALSGDIEGLGEGMCSRPRDLGWLAAQLGIDYAGVRAPRLVSIDVVEELPGPLRSRGLYVVRLGQRHSGRASFILCRASPMYRREALGLEDMLAAPVLPASPSRLPGWLLRLVEHLGSEAFALLAARELAEMLAGDSRVYVLPSLRLGSARFRFRPGSRSGIYTYHGQVEVDAVLGEGSVYALEAKALRGRRRVFKYKQAFSAQALAEALGTRVYPVLAYVGKKSHGVEAYAALLEPPARPGTPYPVEEMRPRSTLVLKIEAS